jgi:hypothetical protein
MRVALGLVNSFRCSGPSPSLSLEADKSWLKIYTVRPPGFLAFLYRLVLCAPIILGIHGRRLSILSLPHRRSLRWF